jgi:cation/acetate symporter
MATSATTLRRVNPRLGAYFGIFASAFIAVFLLGLIFAELGTEPRLLMFAALIAPLVLYAVFGVASATLQPTEYFTGGRRVPAVCNGAIIGIAAYGGVGIVSVTGLFYAHGFDAWALVTGIIAGLVLMGILVAPYFRKFGAFTVPSFLARRLESRAVRLTAATVFIVPILLVLVAELSLGVWVARQLTGSHERWMLAALVVTCVMSVIWGGVRGSSWSGTAQAIALVIAVVAVSGIAGLLFTYLPISQLSHGPVIQRIGAAEIAAGVPVVAQDAFAFRLASQGEVGIAERYAAPFTALGSVSFLLTTLTVMLGIAGAPWLVARCTTTPGVHAGRKSLSWAVFGVGFVAVSLSAVAVFQRELMLSNVVGQSVDTLPGWFKALIEAGLASANSNVPAIPATAVAIHRDIVLFALPEAAGLPHTLTLLAYAGALAAVLTAVNLTLMSLANILAEDVISGLRWSPPAAGIRLLVARVMVVATAILAAFCAMVVRTDPLQLVLWALCLSASTAFPAVGLAIWNKRLTALGAIAGMISGFATALVILIACALVVPSVPFVIAGVVGFAVATATAFAVSRVTMRPSRTAIEYIRDMRVPGGETIYDREMRLLRLKEQV